MHTYQAFVPLLMKRKSIMSTIMTLFEEIFSTLNEERTKLTIYALNTYNMKNVKKI